MSQGLFGTDDSKTDTTDLRELFGRLITANHVLHYHEIFNCYGHVSLRNPTNSRTFFIAHDLLPALVSKDKDLVEFQVEDATPVDPTIKTGLSDRYVHSELYKRYPKVNSIVCSHCEDVVPFTVSGVPLRPVISEAGFLNNDVPVWDISRAYSAGDVNDLLVRTPKLGASLASSFSKSSTATGMIYTTISSKITGSVPEPAAFPDYSVVLMRGLGFTVAARGIEEAVYQAIFTRQAAKTQAAALLMERAFGGGAVEGKVDVEGGGKIKGGRLKIAEDLRYLTSKEASDSWATNSRGMHGPWALWTREVEGSSLYRNDCKSST